MIKCIAIDDEPLALRQITGYISKTPSLELAASFSDSVSALDFLSTNSVDLVFVDINMPEMSGLDFVRQLDGRAMVVFTTAYSEYAIDGFRLEAVDYLLKPFTLEDLQRAAAKVVSLVELLRLAESKEETNRSEAESDGKEFISVKADYKTTLVRIADIVYIESEGEYVRLHLKDGSTIMTLFRLKNMESSLPSEQFMRVHRSYIVNLRYITSYAKGRVFLPDGEDIPIGEIYRANFQRYAEEHF